MLFLPVVFAYNLSLLIHYSLAGIFMYFFLKEHKLAHLSCFSGGLIFMFSGMMISYRSFAFFHYTFIWLPLILLFLEKFRKTKKIKFVLISSIFLLLSFFGGFLQIFIYNCLVIVFYIFFYTFFNDFKKNYYFLISLSIFIIVLLVGAIQIIPTLELKQNSFTRHKAIYALFTFCSFNPKLSLMLFFPYIFGAKNPEPYGIPHFIHWLGREDSLEMMRYYGISTIPLFVFGFFKKLKEKYLWLFIVIFSLFMVLGSYNPNFKLFFIYLFLMC